MGSTLYIHENNQQQKYKTQGVIVRPGEYHAGGISCENRDFTLKTHQMFSVHTTPKEFKKRNHLLKLCLRKTRSARKSQDSSWCLRFRKALLLKWLPSTRKRKASVLKFRRLRLRAVPSFAYSVERDVKETREKKKWPREILGARSTRKEANSLATACSLPPAWRAVKLRFHEGLVCTVGLNIEIKLHFHISLV